MAGFPLLEWMLSGMAAIQTPQSIENQRTKGFCYTTTATLTPDTNGHCRTLCLTVHSNSRLHGSFLMRNVNALKRSSRDYTILVTLCSQPFADSLNQKCLVPHKDQKSTNIVSNSWLTLIRRSTQILAQYTQVERSRMTLWSEKTSRLF